MNWFKFYGQDWLTDTKIIKLNPSERLCFITLLCLASASDIQGVIKNIDEKTLISLTHLETDDNANDNGASLSSGVLKKLFDNGMITNDNGMITIINFNKRQKSSLTAYERVKKYREKKRNDNEVEASDNKMITLDKSRVDKSRVDKIREEKRREDKIREEKRREERGDTAPTSGASPINLEKDEINPLIEKFKEVNPTYERLYKIPAQRSALQRLVKKFGAEKVGGAIEQLKRVINQKYAPRITTPIQLEAKLGDLIAFVKQEKSNSKKPLPII